MDTLAPELLVYPDRSQLAQAAAERFVAIAGESVRERDRFTVALSGGTTPRDLYARLAEPPLAEQVNWARTFVFWGDERCVPPDDPESNYRMANQTLLSHVPIPRDNIYRIPANKPPAIAADEYEQTLREFAGEETLKLDLVLLGLGSNGHTASLFPNTDVLTEKGRWCAAVWVPELNAYRITLTAPILNGGRTVVFLVAGADKAETVREVLRGPYAPERLPAQLIRPSGKLYWLLDKEAAQSITSKP